MSPAAIVGLTAVLGFPRVSGDEPAKTTRKWPSTWFSPRERG